MSFARSVLDGADLVVSATTTSEPFVKQEWISPGAFVYSIGKHQELKSAAYKAMGKFVVDSWAQCKTEVGHRPDAEGRLPHRRRRATPSFRTSCPGSLPAGKTTANGSSCAPSAW